MALTQPPAAPDAPGDAPSRANPSTFRALADAFVLWQVGFQEWLADFITWAGTNATELDALQTDVTTKQGTASTAATTASAAAAAVAYIYPGTYASPPSLRPDGSAMQAGDFYTSTGGDSYRRTASAWVQTSYVAQGYMHVRHQASSGGNGGAATAGQNTRTLNTEVTNTISGASLASNQITLPAGTYRISASAPARVNEHRANLYNVTDGAIAILGTSANAQIGGTSDAVTTDSRVVGQVTIAGTKVFSLRTYSGETYANSTAFGVACNDGQVEVYSSVEIFKVA